MRSVDRNQIETVFTNGGLQLVHGWPVDRDARALLRLVHARLNGPALHLAVLIFLIVSGAALVLKG